MGKLKALQKGIEGVKKIAEKSKKLISKKTTSLFEPKPFFINYVGGSSHPFVVDIPAEYVKGLEAAKSDLTARNRYIGKAIKRGSFPNGTILDDNMINILLSERKANRTMQKEAGAIINNGKVPADANFNPVQLSVEIPQKTETKLIPKTQEPEQFFTNVSGQGPQINTEAVELPVKYNKLYLKPEEIIGSTSTPTVEKSNYTNNKFVSKKERGKFGSTASYVTGDNRHSNTGYSKVQRSQDDFDWETLKNYKEYKAEAHRLEVKEAQGQNIKEAKKILIEKYRKKYRGNK